MKEKSHKGQGNWFGFLFLGCEGTKENFSESGVFGF